MKLDQLLLHTFTSGLLVLPYLYARSAESMSLPSSLHTLLCSVVILLLVLLTCITPSVLLTLTMKLEGEESTIATVSKEQHLIALMSSPQSVISRRMKASTCLSANQVCVAPYFLYFAVTSCLLTPLSLRWRITKWSECCQILRHA
jgi:hypothetical protein